MNLRNSLVKYSDYIKLEVLANNIEFKKIEKNFEEKDLNGKNCKYYIEKDSKKNK
ncbi:MAG: hypothetical protein KatS3mg068_2316 [Candidatus Sericytochromatia bacterium]|nr:MAG: hypothetical protein KatS3mg068_2316 [Candidatus Sericytochromatia bacterium]